ncbi:MAG TPA: dynamin family protein, partial [Nocardioidaceae bacterium]|nr:dynamin family protein [Nocardioidaceae bacterium]
MRESPSAAARSDLGGILAELEALLPEAAPVIRPMRTQWREQLVRVVVLGEAKRGKSSLVNALLGRPILPTGVVPVTSVSTEVTAGDVDEVTVRFTAGGTSAVPLESLGDYVAEDRNRGNHKGVASVTVRVAGTPWPPSVVFVDTPGTGAVETGHEETARTSLRTMDVSLLVLTSDPPISARERALLAEANERSAATLVVLAKADLLAPPDLDTVVGYTAEVVADALGGALEVVAVSTLGDSPTTHPGIRRVADAVLEVAARSAERTLHRSLSRRIRELVDGELAEIDLGLALLGASTAEADRRAVALMRALAEIRDRARVSADLVEAGIRRLDAELDAGAKAEVRRLAGVLVAQAMHSPSSEDEAVAVAGLVRTATEYAESWR